MSLGKYFLPNECSSFTTLHYAGVLINYLSPVCVLWFVILLAGSTT